MARVDENRAIARREIEEFEGRGQLSLGAELFAPDYKLIFGGHPAMDRAGHEHMLGSFREGFPDLSIRVAAQVTADGRIANHWIAQGTHRGTFQGIPATGKAVTITGNNLMHIEDGRIRALWGQLDGVGLMAQLGVMPGPPPAYPAWPDRISGPGSAAARSADVIRRFVEKFNNGLLDRIDEEYDESYLLDFPGGPAAAGKSGIRQATQEFRTAFPDLHFSIDDLFGESDRAAWRWTMTGTHKGQLGPFPPSGRPVRLPGISLFQLRDGRIERDRVRADMVGLLAQIGAIPAPA
jgi:steroid delta-isomerase-like uncharacterized protein